MELEKKDILVRITKDVYWEDWGTNRLVFRKGWEGVATGYFLNEEINSVSGESPIYRGVSDEIWDGHFELIIK